jgi:hypothetical protein
MPRYEYKVVPAPKKGQRAKGVRGTEAKFANALQNLLNEYGADGWEYQRTDTLPCEERSGLRGKTTVFQNMLVFRRALAAGETAPAPAPLEIEDLTEVDRSEPPLRRNDAELAHTEIEDSSDAAAPDPTDMAQADEKPDPVASTTA